MKKKTQKKKKTVSKKKNKAPMQEWVMPFNASFPRGTEFEFELEPQYNDLAVLFEFEGVDDEG